MRNVAIVIGASGGISQAIVEQLLLDQDIDRIIAVSRSDNALFKSNKILWQQSDYSENSITKTTQAMTRYLQESQGSISRIFISNGILQTDTIRPERALKSLTAETMHQVFHANTIVPSLWLAALASLIKSHAQTQPKSICVISVLSARVGSINDNQLGGWHSYRASKAALNMVLKGAAIEFERHKKPIHLLAFHPGTTDTALSKPFQSSVAKEKLFQPKFVAQRLLSITSDLAKQSKTSSLHFLDWNNEPIAW